MLAMSGASTSSRSEPCKYPRPILCEQAYILLFTELLKSDIIKGTVFLEFIAFMVTDELSLRKAELDEYSSRITQVLADPELRPELERAEPYEISEAIGAVARILCIIGEEDEALSVADDLLTTTESDEYIRKGAYRSLVAEGSQKAINIYRRLIETNRDKIGVEGSEYSIYLYCDDLIDLYSAGDETAGAMARTLIEEAGDDEVEAFGMRAAKLVQAGDEAAFPLLLETADRAIAQHQAKEVSELDRLKGALSGAGVDRRKVVPGSDVIMYLSIYLNSIAEALVEKGDLERAEQVQSRLPKEVDRVLIDSMKVTQGLDKDGIYSENVDRLVESAEEIIDPIRDMHAALQILKVSALGGNAKAIAELESWVHLELQEDYVTSYGVESAMVLWKVGKMSEEEFNKVFDLDDSTSHKCEVLEELGRNEEAIQLARDEFANNPDNDVAAFDLLRYEYNPDAMDVVQNYVSKYDGSDALGVVRRRAVWLADLARHIRQLKAAQS